MQVNAGGYRRRHAGLPDPARRFHRDAMSECIHLDLRALPPPQPMQRILDALADLAPGQRLEALTPLRPLPLLPMLAAQGFSWQLFDLDDGQAQITIEHAATQVPANTPRQR